MRFNKCERLKKKCKKRILAYAMAFVMLLTMIPETSLVAKEAESDIILDEEEVVVGDDDIEQGNDVSLSTENTKVLADEQFNDDEMKEVANEKIEQSTEGKSADNRVDEEADAVEEKGILRNENANDEIDCKLSKKEDELYSAEMGDIVDSGNDNKCYWTLDKNGVMIISIKTGIELLRELPYAAALKARVIIFQSDTPVSVDLREQYIKDKHIILREKIKSFKNNEWSRAKRLEICGEGVEVACYARDIIISGSVKKLKAQDPMLKELYISSTEDASFELGECSSLEYIEFQTPLENVSDINFNGIDSLKGVYFYEVKNWNASGVFRGCENLQSVVVEKMEQPAILKGSTFAGCLHLTNIYMEKGFAEISHMDFYDCQKLQELPNLKYLQTIRCISGRNNGAIFYNCNSLKSVEFPSGAIVSTEKKENTASNMFEKCAQLEKVKMPTSVTTLYGDTFSMCPNLWKIEGTDNMSHIGDYGFYDECFPGCNSLKEIKWATLCPKCIIPESMRPFVKELRVYNSYEYEQLSKLENLEKISIMYSGQDYVNINTHFGYESGESGVKTIVLDEKFKSISDFSKFSRLEHIELPSSLERIDNYTFKDCTYLSEILLPDTVSEVGYNAFENCSSLEKVILSNGLNKIENALFSGCTSLKEIEIPNSVTSIEYSAFAGSGLKELVLPESVKYMNVSAIEGCDSLEKLYLPTGELTLAGSWAGKDATTNRFWGNNIYTQRILNVRARGICGEEIEFQNEQLNLDDHVFKGHRRVVMDCDNVNWDDVDETAQSHSIDPFPFQLAAGEVYVYLQKGTIKRNQTRRNFPMFSQLKEEGKENTLYVYIAPEVEEIDTGIFSSDNVVIIGQPGSYAETYAKKNEDYTFQALSGEDNVYGSMVENGFTYEVTNGTATITGYYGKDSDVIIPDRLGGYTVTGIAKRSFSNLSNLRSVSIPATVSEISSCFYSGIFDNTGSLNLKNISVDSANPYYAASGGALYSKDKKTLYCVMPGVAEYSIPEGVTVIKSGAFYGLGTLGKERLVNVDGMPEQRKIFTIPASVTTIEPSALAHRIEYIEFEEGNLKKIEKNAFYGSNDLLGVIMSDSIVDIDDSAFENCRFLCEISFSKNLKNIGEDAFRNCYSLTKLELPDSLVTVGNNAFEGAITNLEYASLGTKLISDPQDFLPFSGTIYAVPKSKAAEYLLAECPEQYRAGVLVDGYTLGVDVEYKAYISSEENMRFLLPNRGFLCVYFRKPVRMTENISVGFEDVANGKKLAFKEDGINGYRNNQEDDEEYVNYIVVGLNGDFEELEMGKNYAVYFEKGSFSMLDTNTMLNGWSSRSSQTFCVQEDHWKTRNNNVAEEIDKSMYTYLFGASKGKVFSKTIQGDGGICFGMAATNSLVKEGKPGIETFNATKQFTNGIENARSNTLNLTAKQYWQLAFLIQKFPSIQKQIKEHKNDYTNVMKAIEAITINHESYIVLLMRDKESGHAVVPYAIEDLSATSRRVYVYDCNEPYAENYIEFEGLGYKTWKYKNEYGSNHPEAEISYCTVSDAFYDIAGDYSRGERYDYEGWNDLICVTPTAAMGKVREFTGVVNGNTFQVEDGNVSNDVLTEIRTDNGSDKNSKSSTSLYWSNGRGLTEFQELPAYAHATVVGDYSSVEAKGLAGATLQLDAADSEEEISIAKIIKDDAGRFEFKISYEDDYVLLHGYADADIEMKVVDGAITLDGAEEVTLAAMKDGQEITTTVMAQDTDDVMAIRIENGMFVVENAMNIPEIDTDIEESWPNDGTTENSKDDKNNNDKISAVKIKRISLSGISKKIAAGRKVTLSAVVLPEQAENKTLIWSSSNPKYATVNSSGVVTTKKAGAGKTVTITARAADASGVAANYKIKIVKHAVKRISLKVKSKTVVAGKKINVKAVVKTTGKTANKTLVWTSSNPKYAAVNKKGKVTAKKAGKGKKVTITAKATDGTGKKAKIKIKIK